MNDTEHFTTDRGWGAIIRGATGGPLGEKEKTQGEMRKDKDTGKSLEGGP